MLVHSVIIGLLLAILVVLIQGNGSKYSSSFQPYPIETKAGANASKDPASIFDTQVGLNCVPGPSKDADYYTQGLTPGGLCGSSEYVRDQMRDYTITGGLSGSLLED